MRLRNLLLLSTALMPLAAPALAGPDGAQVVGGSASVHGQGGANVTVNQFSQNAIINWHTFNIGVGERTQFVQPNASAVILNRVTGGLGPSQILGAIDANGKVMLVNRDGFVFGAGAVINTGSFLATTSDIRNDDFMAGRYNFHIPGRPDASIVNMGTITAASGGFAALVAPGVRNSGTITATLGSVGLAAGNSFSLDFYGDKLITLGVGDAIAGDVKDVATGETLKSLVTNTGKLSANGGRVELTAAAARKVVDSVINTSGVIEANSVGVRNGQIVLSAGTASTKAAGTPKQTVRIAGKLSASGKQAGSKGGRIVVTGENIAVAGATIDASGHDGGGKVLIGGDWAGGKPDTSLVKNQSAQLDSQAIPTATTVSVDAASRIDASATQRGDGGKVILWADDRLGFAGTILALGGQEFGNGGFIETSGKNVAEVGGTINAGRGGAWLLDPANLIVDSTLAATIQTALNNGTDVTQQTATTGPGDGDIIFNFGVSITWNTSATLTLIAFRNIVINDGGTNGTLRNTGAGHLVLRADSTGTGTGTISMPAATNPVRVNWSGSTGSVTAFYNPLSYATPVDFTFGNGRFDLASPNQLTAYMLVNNLTNLATISTNLSGTYALGRDIDATGPTFTPLGSLTTPFGGIFEGNGHTITGLNIVQPTPANPVGMFSAIGAGGVARNFNLANVTTAAAANSQYVGTVAGQNAGTIANVQVQSGTADAGSFTGIFMGGLAGRNIGSIADSSAAVAISGNASMAGGLVGLNEASITASTASGMVSSTRTTSNIGGLAGYNTVAGVITNSTASGNVSGASQSQGGLVGFNGGSIAGSSASGAVTAGVFAYAGGLAAQNHGSINSSSASGAVQGGSLSVIGGLVGHNASAGTIANSSATGNTSGMDGSAAGGLVGQNDGSITGSQASGNATGALSVGGLAGINNGSITASSASGTASDGTSLGAGLVGGLAGINIGSIADSEATGAVIGGAGSTAGGLVGTNAGAITNTHASGNVSGQGSMLGGLVGANAGNIAGSHASGAVTAIGTIAGGLAGMNAGTIAGSSSSGAVSGDGGAMLGGLVGFNVLGTITDSFSVSNVNGTGPVTAGGLAAWNVGSIQRSFATGAVTGGDGSFLGGLVAYNMGVPGVAPGTISQSYATGPVSGGAGSTVGGLAALNFGSLDQTYAGGLVTGGPGSTTGGLVASNNGNLSQDVLDALNLPAFGLAPGTASNSYWDSQTTGQGTSAGGSPMTSAQLTSGLPQGFDPAVWSSSSGSYPFLTGQPNPLPQPGPPAPQQPFQPPPSNDDPASPGNDNIISFPLALTQLVSLANAAMQDPPKTDDVINTQQGSSGSGSGSGAGSSGGNQGGGGRPSINTVPPAGLGPLPSGMPPTNETRFLANEVVMQLGMTMTRAQVEELARRNGIEIISSETFGLLGRTVYRFRITGGGNVRGVIAALQSIGNTVSAQPSYQFELAEAVAPADTKRQGDSAQYIVSKLALPEAHAIATGKNVKVAVIDSEIDGQHPDLQGVIAATYDALPSDDKTAHPHGTGMAGAIASHQRLLGVAPGAKLLGVRAFGVNTGGAQGTSMNIVKGLEWAVKEGAQVINMSFAGPRDPILEQAIKGLRDRGIIMIAASGNAGPKSPKLFPAADKNVIAVSATDMDDKTYKNAVRGDHVAIAAPGVDILVPAPEGGYQLTTGTSVAAAHISGVVALMLERNPRLTPAEVKSILQASARKLPQGRNDIGAGLVDPVQAIGKSAPKSAAVR